MPVRASLLGLCLSALHYGVSAADKPPGSPGVTLFAPEDGGTPRDPNRVETVGPAEFRVRSTAEEGRSTLKHAASRIDLVCRNPGATPGHVTLHLDLSDDGRRVVQEDKLFLGMADRDFVFVQPPGQPWRQVDGTVAGWVATVRLEAPPGDTKVGLSPWYTYGDYLRFVRSLPDADPLLAKKRIGTSDRGREHWELTITDPAVPADKKRTVFWHAREHPYETFSSFAMEGLIGWLLSPDAADARRRYVFALHPMTHIDGVADGYEYQTGYDHPEPRGSATGRLTFAAMDRLRPDFAVAWHNWIAPREIDVVFYTGPEAGKPGRRAWDAFTQHFPSPRAAGHRWRDETTPARYDWQGRTWNERNVHQYAAKNYGTRVWGWEMPWWHRTPADARRLGPAYAKALLAALDLSAADARTEPPEAAPVAVPRWEPHEFTLTGTTHVGNPYRDAAVVGEFTSPSGKTTVVEGFHDGGDTWKLRFAPSEMGDWRYLLRGEGVELFQRGRLKCTAPRGHGPIRVHPDNPYAFAYADGTPFFPMGDTCYGLFDDSPITPERRAEYLAARRGQRFNFVRMSIGHSHHRAAADPASYWAWGGTPDKPDLDRFNPAFFRGMDDLFRQMQAQGMNAEVLLLNYYRRPFTDPTVWTPDRERQWLRYVTARFAAFPNVFLWTVANEYETHPDGKYRLDLPGDPEWAKGVARFVKDRDPYRHPVTVHPVVSASTKAPGPKSPYDAPWRVGEFFGPGDAIDVISQQTGQWEAGTAWDEALQCWTGDSATVTESVRADRRFKKPVMNTENGYEYVRGGPTGRKQVHHTDKVRRTSWRVVCAGGYVAAGFRGTLGHSDAWNRIDAPNRYTFTLQDEGAAGQLGLMYDFFAGLPYWRMQPFDGVTGEAAVALADPGDAYVVFLPKGGKAAVDLTGVKGPFAARWFNPRDGRWAEAGEAAGGRAEFVAPDANDWALLLRRVDVGGK